MSAVGGTMLKPIGLTEGHYECYSLDETLPIFTDLLAMRVIERTEEQAVVKHPNTAWRLVIHEGGPNAKRKPHTNHYGFRVATHKEIPKACEYISDHKDQYKIKSVTKPHEAHFAYSIYFKEPGGNDLEIEYYNSAAIKQGRRIAAPHWAKLLTEEEFPGRGYVPQAMTHGTLNCDDKETSDRFLANVLGLDIIGGGRLSTYISVPSMGPWYVVVLPAKRRDYLTEANRFTLKLATPEEVEDAHKEFSVKGKQLGIQELRDFETNGRAHFLLSDINKNWWEITS